jgi:hypothetical protein
MKQDFAETYRNLTDAEIADIHARIDTLTDASLPALLAEIKQRKLTQAQLQKLHATELRSGAKFDSAKGNAEGGWPTFSCHAGVGGCWPLPCSYGHWLGP